MKPWHLTTLALTLTLTWALTSPAHAGPVSKLYLDSYSDKSLYIVQGDSVVGGPAPAYCNHCEAPIAVYGDVRTMSDGPYGMGGQYKLDLSQTGVTYASAFPNDSLIGFADGATDGRRNYAVSTAYALPKSTVYAFNREWGGPTVLFELAPGTRAQGITFDPTNNSLWLQGTIDRPEGPLEVIQDYDLSGTLLSQFESKGGRALALDYADGTLWSVRGPTRFFDQYSKTGTLLQTATYEPVLGFQGGSAGAEFDLAAAVTVPEPGSIALVGLALAGLLVTRSRRR